MGTVTATITRQFILKSRPVGQITDETFEARNGEVPKISEGQIRCENLSLSLDPAMRGWISESAITKACEAVVSAMVDAAGVIGNFQRVNRIDDGMGLEVNATH